MFTLAGIFHAKITWKNTKQSSMEIRVHKNHIIVLPVNVLVAWCAGFLGCTTHCHVSWNVCVYTVIISYVYILWLLAHIDVLYSHFAVTHKPWVWQVVASTHDMDLPGNNSMFVYWSISTIIMIVRSFCWNSRMQYHNCTLSTAYTWSSSLH